MRKHRKTITAFVLSLCLSGCAGRYPRLGVKALFLLGHTTAENHLSLFR